MPVAAVFLDRDGVLNEIVERDGQPGSPRSLPEFRIVPDLAHIQRLRAAGMLIFVVTNQPDVARGLVGRPEVAAMMARLAERMPMDDYRVCEHDDADDCGCRKPRPGMLLELAHHWRVDLNRSYMVGDMWRDVEAARAAGCRSVLLRRPYNAGIDADAEAATLAEAVDIILGHWS
jgi:D-glycero-D-manno-heptose 1,7-bisphosphate phosphatase